LVEKKVSCLAAKWVDLWACLRVVKKEEMLDGPKAANSARKKVATKADSRDAREAASMAAMKE